MSAGLQAGSLSISTSCLYSGALFREIDTSMCLESIKKQIKKNLSLMYCLTQYLHFYQPSVLIWKYFAPREQSFLCPFGFP